MFHQTVFLNLLLSHFRTTKNKVWVEHFITAHSGTHILCQEEPFCIYLLIFFLVRFLEVNTFQILWRLSIFEKHHYRIYLDYNLMSRLCIPT